jgi:hypothetical protein
MGGSSVKTQGTKTQGTGQMWQRSSVDLEQVFAERWLVIETKKHLLQI